MSNVRPVLAIALFMVGMSLPWSTNTTTSTTINPGYSTSSCSADIYGGTTCSSTYIPGTVSFWSNINVLKGREGGARFVLGGGVIAGVFALRRRRAFRFTTMVATLPFLLNESGMDLIRGGALCALAGMALLTDWKTRPRLLGGTLATGVRTSQPSGLPI